MSREENGIKLLAKLKLFTITVRKDKNNINNPVEIC